MKTTINIKDLVDIVKSEKPFRFNRSNENKKFNNPRITDFAYVNHKRIWELARVFKRTGVKVLKIRVDYDDSYVIFTSPSHKFEYKLTFDGSLRVIDGE